MADRVAQANGNWSDVSKWDGGETIPAAGDTVYLNGKTIALNCSTAELAALYSGTSGTPSGVGNLTIALDDGNGSRILHADIITAGTVHLLNITNATSVAATLTVQGNCNGGGGFNKHCLYVGINCYVNVVGNVTGGSGYGCAGVYNTANATIIITGNVIASLTGNSVYNFATGSIIITGDVISAGGSGTHALFNGSTGSITITGNVTGGSVGSNSCGIYNNSSGAITVTGNVIGGSAADNYGINSKTGIITVTGNLILTSNGLPVISNNFANFVWTAGNQYYYQFCGKKCPQQLLATQVLKGVAHGDRIGTLIAASPFRRFSVCA
ncbi:MAG: hypothetical protein ACYC54_08875 [Sedimentisphaerales bacterium]